MHTIRIVSFYFYSFGTPAGILMPQTLCMPNLMCSSVRSGFLQTLLFLEASTATVDMALQPFFSRKL
ncbi:hypothetical protein WK92_29400 [Burkholderia ubonensis]|nr:hypothetical protein WK82_03155 [Burkholderia ubonensis]KVW29111.1 hypothetical protein WK92_29400 [Burkholderia ubonensis]